MKRMILIAVCFVAGFAAGYAADVAWTAPIATGETIAGLRVEFGQGATSFVSCARPYADGEGYGWELIPGAIKLIPINASGEEVRNLGWSAKRVEPNPWESSDLCRMSRAALTAAAPDLGLDWSTASGSEIQTIVAYTFAKQLAQAYYSDPAQVAQAIQDILAAMQP